MGGTSMACPHVSGVVGLMLANGIAKEDIMDVLQRTAMEIHLPTPNIYFGHGLVNAYWAVNALDDGDLLIIQGIRNGNQIEIANSTPLPLKGGQFRLDMTPGEYQFIAWIDVNKNGLVDAGDYYVETPVLEIEVADSWTWTDTLTELPFDLTGEEAGTIAAHRGAAQKAN
jgi:subtilisin family serine protease